MSTASIIMLIVAILTVWGGLALALLNLQRHPEDDTMMPEDHAPEL
ncbi:methionine/alanine import family NSS transporter small subunit [Arthrobacter crystallopoietes]|jgi:hypothetical protein|nr:methionine/alanine import family NSS transporter small subunit [Arthrobacter sp. Marseille-P9274]